MVGEECLKFSEHVDNTDLPDYEREVGERMIMVHYGEASDRLVDIGSLEYYGKKQLIRIRLLMGQAVVRQGDVVMGGACRARATSQRTHGPDKILNNHVHMDRDYR